MSADNGIYIGDFAGKEFRVIHAGAIENIEFEPPDGEQFNPESVINYFHCLQIFRTQQEALKYAHILSEDYDILEYGISFIHFPKTFAEYEAMCHPCKTCGAPANKDNDVCFSCYIDDRNEKRDAETRPRTPPLTLTFKTPDVMYYGLKDLSDEDRERWTDFISKWVEGDEYVTLAFDIELGTCTVQRVR
jgi:hypothetical protein